MDMPSFLVIGAMKCGTTTLTAELSRHPEIFTPPSKEPETLIRFGDDLDRIRADYRSLFAAAPRASLLGEASTAYTKRPIYEGVAERAAALCGNHLKVIYMVRDPVARILSHYNHEYNSGKENRTIERAVAENPIYIEYSRYEYQLEPWISKFPKGSVFVLHLEHYQADPNAALVELQNFLGVKSVVNTLSTGARLNASSNRRVARGASKALIASRFYQRRIKPIFPGPLKTVARYAFPKASLAATSIDPRLEANLRQRLQAPPPGGQY